LKREVGTYSNRTRRARSSTKLPRKARLEIPRWIPYGLTALFALVLCFTINFRAFTELSTEVEQNESLNQEIEKLTSENLNLQEEIYYLQNDSSVIEREAKKFGFQRKEKKVPVPVDR
jgi:cell division protein FtsL